MVLHSRPAFDRFALDPSSAQIGHLDTLPELAGSGHVWLEIVPITAGVRLWTFLSVTNNSIPDVTVITPSS